MSAIHHTHSVMYGLLSFTYTCIHQCFIAKKGSRSNSVFPLYHSYSVTEVHLNDFLKSHVKVNTAGLQKGTKMCEII